MKIGTSLILEVKQPKTNRIHKFRCNVIERNEHYLFIDYPINEQTNKTAFLPKRTTFSVTYVADDQSVYTFRSEIVAKVNLTIPALAINLPKQDRITRIQRRQYVRIDTAVDVTVHSNDDAFNPFTTVTTDISGGGISIIVPNGVLLAENNTLDTWLVLPMQSGDYHYVYAQTKVVRIKLSDNTVKTASLSFASISRQDRQLMIQYCFEKQREERKKELL